MGAEGSASTDLQPLAKGCSRLLTQTQTNILEMSIHETNSTITEVLWLPADNSLLCEWINGFINKTLRGYLALLIEKMRILYGN